MYQPLFRCVFLLLEELHFTTYSACLLVTFLRLHLKYFVFFSISRSFVGYSFYFPLFPLLCASKTFSLSLVLGSRLGMICLRTCIYVFCIYPVSWEGSLNFLNLLDLTGNFSTFLLLMFLLLHSFSLVRFIYSNEFF